MIGRVLRSALVLAALATCLLAAATSTTALAASAPAPRATPIPISPAGPLAQYNLSSSSYGIARRFVLPESVTIDRWYFAANGEGAGCVGGREGYGSGDGGTWLGRIVTVDPQTGLPTGRSLAAETVNGCVAYERAKDEFGLNSRHQAQYVQFPPVTLQADTMYAFILTNVDSDPGDGGSGSTGNHMSPNLNLADVRDMGPHARNTLDPGAPGAAYGVDPREATMWSGDSGRTWKFGDDIGWYNTDDGRGGMWPGGYRIAGGGNVAHGWTYMNWPPPGPASVSYTAAANGDLMVAGGASANGDDVGVITVENSATGVSASTAPLGSGLVAGALDRPVPVQQGQLYVVSTRGDVGTGSAESWDRIFDIPEPGAPAPRSTCGDCRDPADRPMLYASTTGTAQAAPGPRPGDGGPPTALVVLAIAAVAGAAIALLIRFRRARP